ncbi:MAG TPA: DNA polymerase III subunit gamma/tau [Flavobacteriales bacterium]|nr:DNA polymerase III subunit gamma/tau [Flavobacteriales bacterium]HQW31261.1 DNA polymerase III subunit gamma/tau [Flavobacteriales bacterium]HQY01929.1 DNA polymerase III subunit gamma/tau [Flavobacteriales bacterium]HQY79549.1 DNA polymerase III subunit gamma/tau [Flavobacteriales bacterium]HRA16969.1 DNA polymerase III subunit gamma/tau [Flavobacteriales bacterium]
MERYVVSARKYRPDTFDSVVGQEHVTGTLKNAVRTDHVAQAFLFTGPRGVGKTTCARILARTINCENLNEDVTTCGECPSCKSFDEGHSLNIFELDAASNNSVDDIRNLIQQVQIAPQVGTKKVYIIDEVHMLSSAAFNAFLKTLEEPPSYAIFILATTEKHKILPTILSRCQVFDFRRITVSDIAKHLAGIAKKEGITAEAQALHTIAQKADGGLRDALSIFDQLVSFGGDRLTYADVLKNLNVLDHEHYFNITDSLVKADPAGALVIFNDILFQGFDGHLFVAGLARHLRDLLVSQDPRTIPLLEVSDELGTRYAEQAQAVPRELLVQGLDRLGQVDSQYKNSKEPRLLVELALIQLAHHGDRTATAPTAQRPAVAQEKKSPDLTKATATVRPTAPAATTVAEPEPAQRPAPAAPVASAPERSSRRMAGAVSIRQHLDSPAETMAGTDLSDRPGDQPMGKSQTGPTRELNQALLLKTWGDHAKALKQQGKSSMHATLIANKPVITGPRSISFTIVNTVQENYMKEEKPALLGHLRREMGVPGLELEVTKQEAKDLRPRYTAKDRFMIMAEKNPALLKLREDLDLDLG